MEIDKLNVSKFYDIDKNSYPSSKLSWIKKLENSELGDNLIIDLA